jgi:hypothetical protein
MQKILATLVLALLFACGAPPEDGEYVIGTHGQAIFMPFEYGMEGGTDGVSETNDGMKCTAAGGWEDSRCSVPDSKTIRFKFYASTCNSTWQGAAVDAYNDWKFELESQGWSVIDGTNYQLRCSGSSGGGALGRFQPGPSWDHHDVSLGTLSQFKDGKYTMYSTDADAWLQSVFPGSAPHRQIGRINLIKHELYHSAGFGHSKKGFGPDLMAEAPDGTWYDYKDLGDTRRSMLDCYNQNSGTGDDC